MATSGDTKHSDSGVDLELELEETKGLKSNENSFPSSAVDDEELARKRTSYYRRNELPVDRGWAWAICLAGFLSSFVMGLANQTMAVLFLEVIDLFQTTLTEASLIFLCSILGASCMTLFSTNYLVPRVGEKIVVCVSGVLFAVSSVGYSFSPTIEMFLCWAALKGLCAGAVFVPSISLIRHYFHRRRSIANIVGRAGASAAIIVVPPLVRVIRKEFGVQGTFLIVAALETHMIVAGLMLRPVESYKFRPELPPLPNERKGKKDKSDAEKQNKQEQKDQEKQQGEQKSSTTTDLDTLSRPCDNGHLPDSKLPDATISLDGTPCPHATHVLSGDAEAGRPSNGEMRTPPETNYSLGRTGIQSNGASYNVLPLNSGEGSLATDVTNNDYIKEFQEDGGNKNPEKCGGETMSLLRPNSQYSADRGLEDEDSADEDSTDRLRANSLMVIAGETEIQEEHIEEDQPKSGCCRYDFCGLWTFHMLLVFTIAAAGNLYLRNYIPTIAVSQGATLDEAALLTTLLGVLDFVSRLCVGFFADSHLLKPSHIVAIAQISLGLTCHLTRLFTSFHSLIVFISLFGLFIGTRISMMPLICIEVVGVEMMPQAFSIITMLSTLGAAAMNPILGAVAEKSGSFVLVTHIVGTLLIISAVILMLLFVGRKVDKRNRRKKDTTATATTTAAAAI